MEPEFKQGEMVYLPRYFKVMGGGSWAKYQAVGLHPDEFKEAHYLELDDGSCYWYVREDFVRGSVATFISDIENANIRPRACPECADLAPIKDDDYICVWCRHPEVDKGVYNQYYRMRAARNMEAPE